MLPSKPAYPGPSSHLLLPSFPLFLPASSQASFPPFFVVSNCFIKLDSLDTKTTGGKERGESPCLDALFITSPVVSGAKRCSGEPRPDLWVVGCPCQTLPPSLHTSSMCTPPTVHSCSQPRRGMTPHACSGPSGLLFTMASITNSLLPCTHDS